MLHPLEVNHARGEVECCISGDIVVRVGHKVRPSGPSETAILHRFRLDWGMVENSATSFKKRANVIGQPERRKDRAHWSSQPRREMVLGDHQWNIGRYAIV